MRIRSRRRFIVPVLICVAIAGLAAGQALATTTLTTQLVGSGFTRPVFVTNPPGDTERLFVVEQRGSDNRGRIKIIRNGATLAKPFLTTAVLASGNEQGLLGMAFAPDYATSGRFYIHYNDTGNTSRLVRCTVSSHPDTANTSTQIIYSLAQPFTNHKGGWIAFGPDGYLWVAFGDGGSADDPGQRAQNINLAFGKILRFDVSGAGNAVAAAGNPFEGATPGLDEVWCLGLRNPWRCSFDRETGDLIIGDVGQNAVEEIDFAPADMGRGPGWNYGWRCYEGNNLYLPTSTTPCTTCTNTGCFRFPAHTFTHAGGNCSVTGGYVYRGCKIPDWQGVYFFADYCSNQIWSGRFVNGLLTGVTNRTAMLDPTGGDTIGQITSFSEDNNGELLIIEQGGQIWRVVPNAAGVAEADMPLFQVTTTGGDVLGATTPGNAITPGITPFADAGSRLRGVGYLRNAQIRACPEETAECRQSFLRLGTFDIDVTVCVDVDSAILTRTFLFTNIGTGPAELDFRDVVAPYLAMDPDQVYTYGTYEIGPEPTYTKLLALSEAMAPDLWITHQGFATGAWPFSWDADTLTTLAARVAADEPLANRPYAGPARVAMALGFNFGSLDASRSASVRVVTQLQTSPPTGVEPGIESSLGPSLRILGSMPFRGELRLAFGLARSGTARLDVFDVRGRRVRRLLDEPLTAGRSYQAVWDGRDEHGRDQGAGLYFVRLRTDAGERSLRVVRVQ